MLSQIGLATLLYGLTVRDARTLTWGDSDEIAALLARFDLGPAAEADLVSLFNVAADQDLEFAGADFDD